MQRETVRPAPGARIVETPLNGVSDGMMPGETTIVTTTGLTTASSWRAKAIAFLRIAFGVVWAIAAWFKWQPGFISSFSDTVTGAKDGQPSLIAAWINFWGNIVSTNPHFYAYLVASIETALAVFFIFGLLTNLTCVVSIIYALGIWSIAEGFGGPFQPGKSTDIGPSIMYALISGTLLAIAAGRYYGVDRWLSPRLGRLSFLAVGPLKFRRTRMI